MGNVQQVLVVLLLLLLLFSSGSVLIRTWFILIWLSVDQDLVPWLLFTRIIYLVAFEPDLEQGNSDH